MHLACTAYLTLMHTGDRSASAINTGGVLPGYDGILVRDGYNGYAHLDGALHAWCGAHLLRDLKDVHDAEPALQECTGKMACLLLWARDAAAAARAAGQAALNPAVLDYLVTSYRAITAEGITASQYRHHNANARTARSLARRFAAFEDMILRFATPPRPGHLHQQRGRARHPPCQGPAAQLRRMLAHPGQAWPTSPSSSPTCPPPGAGRASRGGAG